MRGGATFDGTGAYRYHLWREWDAARPAVTFVMLNPSVADAERDDPTIRRCLGFARAWGFGRLEVVNLFAYRATTPRALVVADDPVGPDNTRWVEDRCGAADTVVLAWGNGRRLAGALPWVPEEGSCLGVTKLGEPRHPLYVSAATPLQRFKCPATSARSAVLNSHARSMLG